MILKPTSLIKFLLGIFTITFLLANSGNPPNGRTGAPGESTCGGCHSGASYQGNLSIAGVPATITPNTTYTVTLSNTATVGSPVTGGFQLVVLDEDDNNIGDLVDISSDVRTTTAGGREYAEQDGDKNYSGSVVDWTFEWTSPASAAQNGDITFYYVTVMTNNNGSTSGDKAITNTTTVNLPGGAPLDVTVSKISDVSCFGGNDGIAIANVSGGSSPYTYNWSSGSTSSTATNLSAGNNTVTITDASNNTVTGSVFINQPSPLSVGLSATQVSCNGDSDGLITAIPAGGTSPYSFNWSTGATTSTINNLSAGTYSVTITDDNQCQTVNTTVIFEPAAITSSIGIDNEISCFGGNDGALTVSVSGGTPNYSYSWSTGATTASINNLNAGVYTVTITDANGCAQVEGLNLGQPSVLTLTLESTDETVFGGNDGTATAIAGGGTPAYTYAWSNGATTPVITNLAPGIYGVTVSDQNDCQISGDVEVLAVDCNLAASSTSVTPSCLGSSDGSISVTVSGQVGVVTYQWSHDPNLNGPNAGNLSVGVYSVTITDELNCSSILAIDLPDGDAISIGSELVPVSCSDSCDASIVLTPSGGNGSFNVLWSTGETGLIVENLCAGNYSATVTDALGCQENINILIENPSPLALSSTITDVDCNGASTGGIQITASGGTSPYSYAWSTGATTPDITNLPASIYTLTITDNNGCTLVSDFNVGEPDSLSLSITVTDESANDAADGSIEAAASGGSGAYDFLWSTGDTTALIENLAPGFYTVVVTDANGCELSGSATVGAFDCNFEIELLAIEPACFAGQDGALETSIISGEAPFDYNWSTGSTSASITDLTAGPYSLTVVDASNCSIQLSYELGEPDPLELSASIQDAVCFGSCDGAVNLTVSGGSPPYTFEWSTGTTDQNMDNLCAGVYTVSVTDNNGCIVIDSFTIVEPVEIVGLIATEAFSCLGSEGQDLWIEVSNNQGAYNVNWSPNGEQTDTIQISGDATYLVTIEDELGCTVDVVADFDYYESMQLEFEVQGLSSVNSADGGIQSNILGGVGPLNYEWNTGATTPDIEALSPGVYSLTVMDDQDCIITDSVQLDSFECNLSIDAIITGPSCALDSTGSIVLEFSNGLDPFDISWSTGDSNAEINNLAAGIYSVSVTDANGCSQESVFELGIVDQDPPVLAFASIAGSLDNQGNYALPESDVQAMFTDECGIAELSYFPVQFDCEDIGEQTISFTICDINDNCLSSTFELVLSDELGPAVTCPEDIVLPNCQTEYFYQVLGNDNCSEDNIDIELVSGVASGGAFPEGITEQVYLLSDELGNSSSCTFTVDREFNLGLDVTVNSNVTTLFPGDTILITNTNVLFELNSVLESQEYFWSTSGNIIANDLEIDFQDWVDAELLELEVIYGGECSEFYYFELDIDTQVKDLDKNSWSIYPNPVDDKLFIKGLDIDNGLNIKILSIRGEAYESSWQLLDDGIIEMDLSAFPPRVYLLQIIKPEGIMLKRIVVL